MLIIEQYSVGGLFHLPDQCSAESAANGLNIITSSNPNPKTEGRRFFFTFFLSSWVKCCHQAHLTFFFLLPFVSTLKASPTVSALNALVAVFFFLITFIGHMSFYSTFHQMEPACISTSNLSKSKQQPKLHNGGDIQKRVLKISLKVIAQQHNKCLSSLSSHHITILIMFKLTSCKFRKKQPISCLTFHYTA